MRAAVIAIVFVGLVPFPRAQSAAERLAEAKKLIASKAWDKALAVLLTIDVGERQRAIKTVSALLERVGGRLQRTRWWWLGVSAGVSVAPCLANPPHGGGGGEG